MIPGSGYGIVDTAAAALKQGDFDFLTKPVKPEQSPSLPSAYREACPAFSESA